jgi:hypothetical protein
MSPAIFFDGDTLEKVRDPPILREIAKRELAVLAGARFPHSFPETCPKGIG